MTTKNVTAQIEKINEVFDDHPWGEEKRGITRFYKECFGLDLSLNWEKFEFPPVEGNLKCLEFFPVKSIKFEDVLDSYAKHFHKDESWIAWNKYVINNINPKFIDRPKRDYFGIHVGEIEGRKPDIPGKDYYYGIKEGITFITPFEAVIIDFRYRFETGRTYYDIKNFTYLSAFNLWGGVVVMSGKDGGFCLKDESNLVPGLSYGLRQIKVINSSH